MKKLYLLSCAVILPACSSLTPVNDPVYLRITDIEARLIRIERVLENESLIALAGDIASLRSEVQSLLGEVETLGFELENQAQGNRDLYLDLDRRINNLTEAQTRIQSAPVAGGGAAGGAPGGALGAATDQQAYDAAFRLVDSRNYAAAQAAFENFLATYPASQLRGNAQYWLAETYYAQLEFGAALAEFQRVINNYPQSAKLPDALLKIGYCNDELGNTDAARQALMQVIRQFEGTSAADLAEARLSRLAR